MQLGKQCAKDYLGHVSPQAWITYLETLNGINELVKSIGGGPKSAPGRPTLIKITNVLIVCCASVDLFKYVPSKDMYGEYNPNSTANTVRSYLFWYGDGDASAPHGQIDTYVKANETSLQQRAEEIATWVLNIPEAEVNSNSFYHNVQTLFKEGWADTKHIGYVIGAYPAWWKATQKAKADQAKAAQPAAAVPKASEYVGSIGQKLSFAGTIVNTQNISGMYGNVQLVRIKDTNGNTVVWFNNGQPVEVENGKAYNFTGTVKKQDEYNGKKQTTITRGKVSAGPAA
jgi:hypothetical protein